MSHAKPPVVRDVERRPHPGRGGAADEVEQLAGGTDSVVSVPVDRLAWRSAIDDLIEARARTGVPFTADEIRADAVASGIPEPAHPSAWGARFAVAAERGVIQAVGTGTSSRPARRGLHYRWIGSQTWRSSLGGDAA